MYHFDNSITILYFLSESCSEDNRILSLHYIGAVLLCFGSYVYSCAATKSKKICSSLHNG
jgi:hypothetical protein